MRTYDAGKRQLEALLQQQYRGNHEGKARALVGGGLLS